MQQVVHGLDFLIVIVDHDVPRLQQAILKCQVAVCQRISFSKSRTVIGLFIPTAHQNNHTKRYHRQASKEFSHVFSLGSSAKYVVSEGNVIRVLPDFSVMYVFCEIITV